MDGVIIYTDTINQRIEYVLHIVFNRVLGIEYRLTDSRSEFAGYRGPKINYSAGEATCNVQILPNGLLSESDIRLQDIRVTFWNNLPVFFQTQAPEIPFDIFSAVFYMVTRYEEYLPFIPDVHGRFRADQSLAFRNNFLRLPVVDLWCIELAGLLGIAGKCPNIHPSNYRFELTVDIDMPWTYRNRSLLCHLGPLMKELLLLRIKDFRNRLAVLLHLKPDPADNFHYIEETEKKLHRPVRFFALCRNRGTNDPNRSAGRKKFHSLLRQLDAKRTVGIHPSYVSSGFAPFMSEEIKYLENVLQRKIESSRQHFLRLSLPISYRNLIDDGITHDYSLGFAAQTGFRAGIARSFPFYDLQEEKTTGLMIHPFQVMDRTLLSYLKLTPDEAIEEYAYYAKIIHNVGGEFVSLWHNDSLGEFGEWKGWKKVFEAMIDMNKKA
jgi:hypothetical protein